MRIPVEFSQVQAVCCFPKVWKIFFLAFKVIIVRKQSATKESEREKSKPKLLEICPAVRSWPSSSFEKRNLRRDIQKTPLTI